MPVRKVAEILDDSPGLASLTAVARRTADLQHLYMEAVPAELRSVSRVGWARPGVLTIAAANGAVAAKLRQLAPRILGRFRREGFEFNAMHVEVQVGYGQRRQGGEPKPPLSAEAQASICRVADGLPDSPLKSALARLARGGRRDQSVRSKT
jgi:hypothetical protein